MRIHVASFSVLQSGPDGISTRFYLNERRKRGFRIHLGLLLILCLMNNEVSLLILTILQCTNLNTKRLTVSWQMCLIGQKGLSLIGKLLTSHFVRKHKMELYCKHTPCDSCSVSHPWLILHWKKKTIFQCQCHPFSHSCQAKVM